MFNNLIESASHSGEFKRRGSFVLLTSATYVLFFIVAGVVSIYAYDARLDDQDTESIVMLSPMELPAAPVPVIHETPAPAGNIRRPTEVIREVPMVSVNHPEIVPDTTSATPNTHLPIPEGGRYIIGDHDSGPVEPAGSGRPGSNGAGSGDSAAGPLAVEVGTPPPAVPTPSPRRIVISPVVLNGQALALPKPPYPPIAKQAGAQGSVNVQVVIDETGKVISAKAVSGHPLLIHAAQQAAFQARFSPTMLGEQAVKVSGVIVYNFMLQ